HTTYVDFYILLLYLCAYQKELGHLKTLIKPQPFRYAGRFLRWLGGISATSINDKNGGAVDRIVNELSRFDKFGFLISPKGTIVKSQWRSGYYSIAKQLNLKYKIYFIVAGADYEKKCIIASKQVLFDSDETIIREKLQKKLSKIVPLVPSDEIVPIRKHNPNKVSSIDLRRFCSVIGLFFIIGFIVL
ncbi:MAG: hypothetical protein MUO21_03685, partial [Nitrososphaeraceae archaeon]|nr:hypothetical protein [Nitrososphaeraceae archaeon]